MNKLGKLFILIGILLITISSSLLVYNYQEDKVAGKKSKEVLKIIKDNIKETNDKKENNQIMIEDTQSKEMKTTNINGYDYIGMLTIPSLNLELPIMSEYDYDRLSISPCRYYGSIYTNDLIICGHSYHTHFKYLDNLIQGDTIIFTDIEGTNYIYEVKEIEILNPKDVSKMINNAFDLTLYTCTNDGLNRITVRCNKILGTI